MILNFEFTSFSLVNPQVTSNEIQNLLLLAFLKTYKDVLSSREIHGVYYDKNGRSIYDMVLKQK